MFSIKFFVLKQTLNRENSMAKSIPLFSKIWLKILKLNVTLFLALQEELGAFSSKEEKLIWNEVMASKAQIYETIRKFKEKVHIF